MGKTKKRGTTQKKASTKKRTTSSRKLDMMCEKWASSVNRIETPAKNNLQLTVHKKPTDVEKELIDLFNAPYSPEKYSANDDFYSHINYEWITKMSKQLLKKKRFYPQVDSFRVVQEQVYYKLIDLVKNYIKTNSGKKSREISNVYKSMYALEPKPAEKCILDAKNTIDAIIAENNLTKLLAELNKNEVVAWGAPIAWSVLSDERDAATRRSTISMPRLTLYDYLIYIEDPSDSRDIKSYKKELKAKYLKFVDKMFDSCLGKGHGFSGQQIWDVEYELLLSMGCSGKKNAKTSGYQRMNAARSLKETGFDWAEFTKHLGYNTPPKDYICQNVPVIGCIMQQLLKDDAWKQDKWRAYFYYINFRQIMRFHRTMYLDYFEFHDKFISGTPLPWPKEIHPVIGLSMCFDTFLSDQYIEHYASPARIAYVENIAADLLVVFKRIITRNTWLSPKTKKYALLKLNNIHMIIGKPPKQREDPLLDYDPKDAYGNIMKIAEWRRKQMIALDGHVPKTDIPIIDWEQMKLVGKQSYVVNAYYTPSENSIYVPMGYIQEPFVDMEQKGIEYNLSRIGYTLGHEMSHCLDNTGSQYDYKGNKLNWWSDKDKKVFDAKVKDVIKQYETFAAYDGIKMDAKMSAGEDLADISGLAICVEYLKDFHDKHDDVVPIKSLSFNAFFVYIATQSRQKIFDHAIKAQLKTNPHPLDKYRTNCPLSRLELFRSMFNIKKGDKMYWHSADTIW